MTTSPVDWERVEAVINDQISPPDGVWYEEPRATRVRKAVVQELNRQGFKIVKTKERP